MRQEKSRFIASVAVPLIVAALVAAPDAWAASTYKILHAFRKSSGGANVQGKLVSDAAGNLYGTTNEGGLACECGVVFKLTHNSDGTWTEHVLYRFTGGEDGRAPSSELILDAAGNLYGTTNYGGPPRCGCGVVFKLTHNSDGTWTEHVLYGFMGGTDGMIGAGGLIFDAAGNLYGTTYYGGSSSCGGCGVVFELTPNPDGTWTEQVLYPFTGGPTDGANPRVGMILDAAGNLYGTTQFGGLGGTGGTGGSGTVFELMPNPDGTWTEQVLYRFTGGIDGGSPAGGVILDAAGNLYGTAGGGGSGGSGAVFELTPSSGGWNESVLHSFTGGADGSGAAGWLVFDAAGNLYGTAVGGGVGYGVVFELTRRASGGWRERVLHAFLGYGASPVAGLIRGASGNLYGLASGGTSGGLAFEIKP